MFKLSKEAGRAHGKPAGRAIYKLGTIRTLFRRGKRGDVVRMKSQLISLRRLCRKRHGRRARWPHDYESGPAPGSSRPDKRSSGPYRRGAARRLWKIRTKARKSGPARPGGGARCLGTTAAGAAGAALVPYAGEPLTSTRSCSLSAGRHARASATASSRRTRDAVVGRRWRAASCASTWARTYGGGRRGGARARGKRVHGRGHRGATGAARRTRQNGRATRGQHRALRSMRRC